MNSLPNSVTKIFFLYFLIKFYNFAFNFFIRCEVEIRFHWLAYGYSVVLTLFVEKKIEFCRLPGRKIFLNFYIFTRKLPVMVSHFHCYSKFICYNVLKMPNFNQESYIIELMQDYLRMLSKLPHPRISSCCDIFRQHILYSSPPYYDDIVMLRLALRSSRQECGPWHLLSN